MSDLISVIVPIYNVEFYLRRCVDSILKQTYKNLEIILVDDGSEDSCGTICDAYARNDKRIIVIHKKNGGLSDARNAGLEIIKGKYVTFVDSDDWIEATYVERLYKLLIENNADLSSCCFYHIDENNCLYNSPATDGKIFIWNRKTALMNMLLGNKLQVSAWGKLFRSLFFTEMGFRFPVGRLFEDIPVTYSILLKANKIIYGNFALYNYFDRPQSISNMVFTPKRMHSIEHLEMILPEISHQFPDLNEQCAVALFRSAFSIYLIVDEKKENSIHKKKVVDIIKKHRNTVIVSKYSTKNWRIKAMITYMGLPITKKVFTRRIVKGKKTG